MQIIRFWDPDPVETARDYVEAHPDAAALVPQGYNLAHGWHEGFEVWEQIGMSIYHFNITAAGDPQTQIHIYVNGNGGLEPVGIGQRPSGYVLREMEVPLAAEAD